MKPFNKPALSFADQLTLMRSRGLSIPDAPSAEAFLARVSYYRLSAYALPFEDQRHAFRSGTSFKDLRTLYELDGALQNALMAALGEWEIAFRTRFTYVLGHAYGPFCHQDPKLYRHHFDLAAWLKRVDEEVGRSTETFVTHYRETYTGFPRLPLWMTTELMSFGALSTAYAHLVPEAQKKVAKDTGVHELVLKSWLHSAVYLRNLCAHHARLWNRELAIRPEIPRKDPRWTALGLDNTRIFAQMAVLAYLRMAFDLPITPIARVQAALRDLHLAFPFAAKAMGVPDPLIVPWLENSDEWMQAFTKGKT